MTYVTGPDKRKWHVVQYAKPCRVCGQKPIAARVGQRGVGYRLQCPSNASHGFHFEQWLSKCVRKWDTIQDYDK